MLLSQRRIGHFHFKPPTEGSPLPVFPGFLVKLSPGPRPAGRLQLVPPTPDAPQATHPAPRASKMTDLVLDPQIRVWVFLPIVMITFLVGLIRHYLSLLLTTTKKVSLQQLQDSQVLMRSRLLRENGKYLPKQSFLMRRHFFNNVETGYLKGAEKRPAQAMPNPMTDPSMMTDMLKGNVTNVLPMILIGGWINWTFSGFVTTRVPFPLTLRFKPMLQRGIELQSLDASWVSSASWYFLNVFGLRSIYALVLGENNAADQTRVMQDQMSGAAMAMPPDPKQAFKAEWEALEIAQHQWALKDVETNLVGVGAASGAEAITSGTINGNS